MIVITELVEAPYIPTAKSVDDSVYLSVIIPAHNEEKFLRECVDSVVAATKDISAEIIIVDDGSTDGTEQLARVLQDRYSSVRYLTHINRKNRGVSESRNLGITKARGEFISFIDADDIMLPYRYDKTLSVLKDNDHTDIVLDSIGVFFDDDSQERLWRSLGRDLVYRTETGILPSDYLEAALLGRCRVHTMSLTVRKGLFSKTGLFSKRFRLSEDYHLWLRLFACGKVELGENDRPVAFYRRHFENTWNPAIGGSYHDLVVLGDIARWAKGNQWVLPQVAERVLIAFEGKVYCCFQMARTEGSFVNGIKTAIVGGWYSPKLLVQERYWKCLILICDRRLRKFFGRT
jgi:glycosyltransferase involved in cell wall biosynthesis